MTCPLLLLISLDGFLWSYLQNFGYHNFPNFSKMISQGVVAKHLNNVFLTKTFPNHFTIVTGLFEETHGIINNNMYDPVLNATFRPGNNDRIWWDVGGEPIWVTNQKHSILDTVPCAHRSAVIMWPGSESQIKGEYPTFNEKYSNKMPLKDKFDKVLSLISKNNCNLGVVYHDQPDVVGHAFGPASNEVKAKLIELDKDIGYLIARILYYNLQNRLNIILTSDHGMSYINNTIILSDHINLTQFNIYGSSPTWHLFPKYDQDLRIVYKQLSEISPNLKVYLRENIPNDWNYKNNRRIGHILLVGEPGYHISPNKNTRFLKGNHGFNQSFSDSWPIFIAQGPVFRESYISKPLNSIDIYSLMCHILQIEPSPNNGTLKDILHIMQQNGNLSALNSWLKTSSSSIFTSHNLSNTHKLKFKGLPLWLLVTVGVLVVGLACAIFVLVVHKISHPASSRRTRILYAPYASNYLPDERDPLYHNSPPINSLKESYGLSEPTYESHPMDLPLRDKNEHLNANQYRPVDFFVP